MLAAPPQCGQTAHAPSAGFLWLPRSSFARSASEQERTDVARARRRWIREQGLLDSSRLVFIDQTSVNTNMTRAYDRADNDQGGDERRGVSCLCRAVSGAYPQTRGHRHG